MNRILLSAILVFSFGLSKATPSGWDGSSPCTINVVFHVLHNNGPENIPDSVIHRAMQILNEDYGNPDTAEIIDEFDDIAADTRVRFVLAAVDPNGNPSNGIDRIQTTVTSFAHDSTRPNQWPPEKYLNIWVVQSIRTGLAAYTYSPAQITTVGDSLDGVIIKYAHLLGAGSFNQRLLTRETGMYLGLKTTYSSGAFTSPTTCGDDGISDTPITKGWKSSTCPTTLQQVMVCDTVIVENYQNFMDNTWCSCMFTEGQAAAIMNTFNSTVANRDMLCNALQTDITEYEATLNVTLFPNPANSVVQVKYALDKVSAVTIELTDALGKQITLLQNGKQSAGAYTTALDADIISNLPSALYFVKVSIDSRRVTRKLVVHN